MEYSNDDKDKALEVLSDLVKENSKLKGQLLLANRFTLLMLMSEEVNKSSEAVYFLNSYFDTEEIEKILPNFEFLYNSNNSFNEVNGKFISSVRIMEYNGTPFPTIANKGRLIERVKELLESNFKEIYTNI